MSCDPTDEMPIPTRGRSEPAGGEPTRVERATNRDEVAIELAKGAMLGRYVILETIGEGGMGQVAAAYDPELDRRVAIKILRNAALEASALGRAMLVREAQAMARLAHPNVVAVHDVGELAGNVFVAMELVEGVTLKVWLQQRRRNVNEVLSVFRAAGRGLAAAHAAGLVHRDFKPTNVLVGSDDRARVADFGIAALQDVAVPTGDGLEAIEAAPPTAIEPVLGTPGYMSPEQYAGEPLDARSDQFSFAVCLYEALFGERPFAGETREELARNVLAGVRRPPPRGARVPNGLRRALIRALAHEPRARFPSMDALLVALQQGATQRRRALQAMGGVVTLATVAIASWATARAQREMCDGGVEQLASVWGSTQATTVRDAFAATDLQFSASVAERVIEGLDTYAVAWVQARRDACEATKVRGEQSEILLDLRMRCSSDALARVDALVEVLQHADARAVEHAIQAVGALPELEACADGARLVADEPQGDPDIIAAIREGLSRVQALRTTGDCSGSIAAGKPLVEQARIHDLPSLQAEAALELGDSLLCVGHNRAAQSMFFEGFAKATRAQMPALQLRLALALSYVVGTRLERHDEAARWLALADAIGERPETTTQERGELLRGHGSLATSQERYQDGLSAFLAALALAEQAKIGTERLISLHINVAHCLLRLERNAEAVEHAMAARELSEQSLGDDHPQHAVTLRDVGAVLTGMSRFDEAAVLIERSIAILSQHPDLDPEDLSVAHLNLGVVSTQMNRPEQALVHYDLAIALHRGEEEVNSEHALAYTNRAEALMMLGRLDEAEASARQALALVADGSGPHAAALANVVLGDVFVERERCPEAIPHLRRGLELFAQIGETGASTGCYDLLAKCLVSVGQGNSAVALLEDALTQRERNHPLSHADLEVALARTLVTLGTHPERARGLLASAREAYVREHDDEALASVDEWSRRLDG